MNKVSVIAFGPVINPNGVYGLGIIEVDTVEQVNDLITNDPANG